MYDIIVVGGGPAGMTAALYGLRNGKSVLVIEKEGFGGQITHSPKVENYPGTLTMSGSEFADSVLDQILQQGAEIEIETVTGIRPEEDRYVVLTEDDSFEGRSVILATGVRHRMLGLEGEEDLIGDGISFCAVCDGDFYTGKRVCMVGGGNSALQEAILLSDKCSEVTVLQDLPFFTGEESLQKILFSRSNVHSMTGVRVSSLLTDDSGLCGIEIRREGSDRPETVSCDGLFVAIGLIPENDAFTQLADLDQNGYFASDEQCLTRTPGIFVAGDCRSKSVRQLTTAAADGSTAALAACRYLAGR